MVEEEKEEEKNNGGELVLEGELKPVRIPRGQ
jgi:hypothetical protein